MMLSYLIILRLIITAENKPLKNQYYCVGMYSPYQGHQSYPQYSGSPSVQQSYPYAQSYYANSIPAAAKSVEATKAKVNSAV
jgi:hypothetical protein